MGYLSKKGLRDYAFKVLKSEVGEHVENGIVIPAKYTDKELAYFVRQMPDWQLKQMHDMMYKSGMVE